MNTTQDNHNLEHMLELSKLGADGHKERISIEFRIFVSYLTGLALLFYQVNKPEDSILQNIPSENKLLLLSLSVCVLSLIHYLYCFWQKNISIALINDVRRRDFYLQKAQCLSYHLSRYPNAVFQPSCTKTVSLNKGGGRSREPMTEADLFNERHPDIIKKASWGEFWAVLYDTHIWLQIGAPTLILISLIVTIFKGHLRFQFVGPIGMLICLFVLAWLDNWLSWKKK